ncbi:hypothetical protein GCM10012279_45750 [Micromonospora yangpuensis]|nr:hypothetical protein GCM10012279_45750 [Micromonospora yangpuensis]
MVARSHRKVAVVVRSHRETMVVRSHREVAVARSRRRAPLVPDHREPAALIRNRRRAPLVRGRRKPAALIRNRRQVRALRSRRPLAVVGDQDHRPAVARGTPPDRTHPAATAGARPAGAAVADNHPEMPTNPPVAAAVEFPDGHVPVAAVAMPAPCRRAGRRGAQDLSRAWRLRLGAVGATRSWERRSGRRWARGCAGAVGPGRSSPGRTVPGDPPGTPAGRPRVGPG